MLIKLVGLGVKEYFIDKFNRFDCLVVVCSLAEITVIWAISENGDSGGATFSTFRGFRLLRVFKLARNWRSFQVMLLNIRDMVKDINNFTVLLCLVLFTYTLLGMELFANSLPEPVPRVNFDSFQEALTAIFIVLVGEDWNALMYQYMFGENPYANSLFFISLVIIGNMILLNLFLAILLKNFQDDS